ncbi:MAG: M55 family metallopeptidase [Chloroflexota bacterium]|jgi:D-amino peptidase
MRVYISVDLEGVAGVSHPGPTGRGDLGYPEAVDLMVAETNAAIEGALAAGASAIVVNDSHGGMYNLRPVEVHPAATVVQGQKAWSMVAGADPDAGLGPFGVALFVGYHARAGHPVGTLAHTYSMRPTLTLLDGRPTGEYGLNAAVLGAWGIPVGLVTGDDALAAEVGEWLPWADCVVVKTAVGGNAAASIHPGEARKRIAAGAQHGVERALAGELQPLVVPEPVSIEVDYARGVYADYAAIVPGATRHGDRRVAHGGPDVVTAWRGFLAGLRIAGTVD